jgi:hypothetical protein
MSKSGKKAKALNQPSVGKKPKTVEDADAYLRLYPAWRISRLHFHDPYGWHVLDEASISRIRERLSHLESMTWSEILVKAEKYNHLVEVTQLCSAARTYLTERSIEDIDEVLSLRLTGRERIWGILDRGVVDLLWWDPNHEICPSRLKNT